EWTKADDGKIAKLRGILSALQEENQNTQLLRKVSEDSAAQRALDATRASVDARTRACKDMEEQFFQKQNELRRHWLEEKSRLDKLNENIERSQKRSKDEQRECHRLQEEVGALEADLASQEAARAAEQRRIGHVSMYKEFLEEVVSVCEHEFENDVGVLLNRHRTLEQSNAELHRANREMTGRLDELRERHQRESSALQNEHLRVSSLLHDCQGRLEQARVQNQQVEESLSRALGEKSKEESEVGVIRMAIEQIFERTLVSCRVEQRRNVMRDAIDPKYTPLRMDRSEWRLNQMLQQIGERVEDLRDMYGQARERLKPDAGHRAAGSDDREAWAGEVGFVTEGPGPAELPGQAEPTSAWSLPSAAAGSARGPLPAAAVAAGAAAAGGKQGAPRTAAGSATRRGRAPPRRPRRRGGRRRQVRRAPRRGRRRS
ncbi:unnamed protein product, partial [Prorocentrum cordatum]